jgi:hypothetical protein
MTLEPMLHVRDQALRLCQAQVALHSAAVYLTDDVPRLLLVPAATMEDWEARAARWRVRADLVAWAVESPSERLPHVIARLEVEARRGDPEAQDVAQLVATLRLAVTSHGTGRRSHRPSPGRRPAGGGGGGPPFRRGRAPGAGVGQAGARE